MNDNKTIKVLRILTLSLTLMLLVFALAKKVGLCASDSSDVISISNYPMPYGNGVGWSETTPLLNDYSAYVDYVRGWGSDYSGYDLVLIYENNPNLVYVTNSNYITYTGNDLNSLVITFGRCISVNYSNGNFSNYGSYYPTIDVFNGNRGWYVLNPSGQYSPNTGNLFCYPIFLVGSGSTTFNQLFTLYSSGGGGLDSPGFSDAFNEAYDDWIDSDLNPVDTNAPSNNTSTPAWLQSILNGLGTLNNTIGGGFATIFNKLKDFTSGVFDFFNDKVVPFFEGITDVTEDIKDILSGSLESDNDIYQAWVDGYEDSVFYDLSNIVSSCKNILTSIFNASTPSTLSFNIPTYPVNIPTTSGASNYVYLFGQSISIDFSWYRSPIFGGRSIYDMVNSVFFTFLYVGFLAALFFKVPSLIHGASGFSRAMHGDYNQSMGNASGTPSNSKYDFAAMTQFILDN